jgi:hypothetical protein
MLSVAGAALSSPVLAGTVSGIAAVGRAGAADSAAGAGGSVAGVATSDGDGIVRFVGSMLPPGFGPDLT